MQPNLIEELRALEIETFEVVDLVELGIDVAAEGAVLEMAAWSSSSCSCSSCCSCSTSSCCSTSTSTG